MNTNFQPYQEHTNPSKCFCTSCVCMSSSKTFQFSMSHRRFVVLSSPCLRGCLQTWSGQRVILATSAKRSGLDLQWFCVQQEMIQEGRKWPLHLCRFWCTVWLAPWKCFAQLHRTFSIPKLVGYVGMCIKKKGLYHCFIWTRWRASCSAFQRKAYCELTWLEISEQLLFHAWLALLMCHIPTSSVACQGPVTDQEVLQSAFTDLCLVLRYA